VSRRLHDVLLRGAEARVRKPSHAVRTHCRHSNIGLGIWVQLIHPWVYKSEALGKSFGKYEALRHCPVLEVHPTYHASRRAQVEQLVRVPRRSVLPMQLHVGDRFTDDRRVWS
jgi:hypothetical protein